jgi:site-specific DNA-cytosine methylase
VIEALPHLADELVCDVLAREQSKGGPTTYTLDEPAKTVTQVVHRTRRLLMDSGRASAATTGINPATGKKEGGSGPLFRELSDPSYTVMSSPRNIMLEATGADAKRAADTPLDSPSKTLCGSGNQVGPRLLDHEPEKPVKIRSLTLPETLVLQGFDPDYDLSAARTMKSRWTMLGNAVPPPVAEAVIRGISHDSTH